MMLSDVCLSVCLTSDVCRVHRA